MSGKRVDSGAGNKSAPGTLEASNPEPGPLSNQGVEMDSTAAGPTCTCFNPWTGPLSQCAIHGDVANRPGEAS